MRLAFVINEVVADNKTNVSQAIVGFIPHSELKEGGQKKPALTLRWLKTKEGSEVFIEETRENDIQALAGVSTALGNIKKKSEENYYSPLRCLYALLKKMAMQVVWDNDEGAYVSVKRIKSNIDQTNWAATNAEGDVLAQVVCGSDNEETITRKLSQAFGELIAENPANMSMMQEWLDNHKEINELDEALSDHERIILLDDLREAFNEPEEDVSEEEADD